jgi:hypothetical protein
MNGDAVLVIPVSRSFVLAVGEETAQEYVSRMAEGDWALRGPHGGRYLSPAHEITVWHADRGGFFERDADRYIGRRPPPVYVRPRPGQLRRRWDAALRRGPGAELSPTDVSHDSPESGR